MADAMRDGQIWLAKQLKAHLSTQVIYQRDADQLSIAATIGRTMLKLDDEYGGSRIQWTDRDFIIQSADLVLASAKTLPQVGDRILETIGDTTSIYEVMVYGNEPAWRFSDPFGTLLRIHTKLVGVA